jgi:lysyl-tRNA synthetase class 2
VADDPPSGDGSRLDELVDVRRAKARALRDLGVEPYAYGFRPTHTLAEVVDRWGALEAGEETGEEVTVAGRVVADRDIGRLRFLVLREAGIDLQLFVMKKRLDDAATAVLDNLDVGDWLGTTGDVLATRTGELSVRPTGLTMLSKALRPLPDKHGGLVDVEARSRQRELDLVVNQDSRRTFEVRHLVLRALREEMTERGFVEVETPMLHPIPGGAAARPFVTHHNALDVDLYLRIAPELYLKRLVVGGFPRVFELGRTFRNEGMSPRHNPEFTMLESYEAYADMDDVLAMTEQLVVAAATAACGTTEVSYQGREVSLAAPFRRATLLDLVREATGLDDLDYGWDVADLRSLAARHDVAVEDAWGPGKILVEVYEALVEDGLWAPTFVTDHPVETSPLARRHRDPEKPHVTERFELIVTGREMANAFTELIDADDQRERFAAQARAKAAGDEEAMVLDEPYLRAMEQGMPPCGGLGVGVDRLVMLLADVASIRDVILFPTLRPEVGVATTGDGDGALPSPANGDRTG